MPRKKKIEQKPEIKWYDVNDIYKKGADITMCYGQRVGGKTYSALRICLREYKSSGLRFVYLRRWTDDTSTFACSTLIKQELIDEVFGEGYEVRYRNHTFTLVHTEVKDNKDIEIKEDIGYAAAISEAKHRKGTNFPNVHIVFFDEFIDMSGENVLANEYNKYENIISTIKRANKIRIIMCANTVSKYSEYFTKLGINPDKISQGEIKEVLHPNGQAKVIVQWCPYNEAIGEIAGDLTNSKMIKTGAWEIRETDDIPSEENERSYEQLLFTAYSNKIDAKVGMYVRYGEWESYEPNELNVIVPVEHEREFLVVRRIPDDVVSSYYNLTSKKSLAQTDYHKLAPMLHDIEEECDIDVEQELIKGRVFCDDMFTGDIFNEIWDYYSVVKIRELL